MPYGNIDLRGATLMHLAVEFGEIECVDVLLARGMDVNLKSDLIDGVGGQTPIFHAIATNQQSGFATLEHLVQKAGRRIDLNVRASFRVYGEIQIEALTPLEYAIRSSGAQTPPWRRASEREIKLLESLD
jgi:ankyrin repeat protein